VVPLNDPSAQYRERLLGAGDEGQPDLPRGGHDGLPGGDHRDNLM